MNKNSDFIQRQADPPDGAIPARPALQQRSRETRDRLLAAGRRLLEQTDLDAVSISGIAGAAGCSVGAFYNRFENKDAFFRTMIADMLATERASLDQLKVRPTVASVIETAVGNAVGSFRRNAGLLRSALRKGMEDGSFWEPIRLHGQAASDLLVARLGEVLGSPLALEAEMRVRFASQILYGTLVNALLHRPGPLRLESERLADELVRVFRLTVALGDAPPRDGAP